MYGRNYRRRVQTERTEKEIKMPVPDEFNLFDDYMLCEICNKDYPLSTFAHVVVDNDKMGEELEKRYCAICSNCREKCRNDTGYEKYVTEKVFKIKLGRRIS